MKVCLGFEDKLCRPLQNMNVLSCLKVQQGGMEAPTTTQSLETDISVRLLLPASTVQVLTCLGVSNLQSQWIQCGFLLDGRCLLPIIC